VPKSNLAVRLLTAFIVAPLLIVLLFLGPPWGFSLVVIAASALASREVLRMTHPGDAVAQNVLMVLSVAVTVVLSFFGTDIRAVWGALVLAPLLGMLVPLARLGDIATAAFRIMAGAGVLVYVGGSLGMLARLRADVPEVGAGLVLFTLQLAWLGDTGGYFVGRFFGKTPLYPAVSPKKTRAGLFGAVLGAVGGGLLASLWYAPVLPLGHAVVLGIFCGFLGQAGDLTESLLKRSTGIKDSGGLLPGHGGMLDRIDALLVITPVVYLYTLTILGR
jgi:phosphatidate cytidylyltransferase